MTRQSSYYFLHIPKTAGTSFRVVLENQFDASEICQAYEFYEIKSYSTRQLNRFRLFRGHMGFNLANYLPSEPRILCMLRNPIERTVSHFEYIKKDPAHPHRKKILENNMNLKDFLLNKQLSASLRNALTKPLCHTATQKQLADMLTKSSNQQAFAKIWNQTPEVLPPIDEMLDLATTRLEEMYFVGIAEALNDSLDVVSWLFKNRQQPQQALNINPNRTKISHFDQETLDLLAELTATDQKLYTYAYELFSRKQQVMIQDLLEQRYINHQRNRQSSKPTSKIDFNQPLLGTGWHQRELFPGMGIGRWTGPGTLSDLDVTLDPGKSYNLTMRIIDYVDRDMLREIRLYANHQPLEAPSVKEVGSGMIELSARIEKQMLTSDTPFTRIAILTPYTRPQASKSDGEIDHNYARRVGIAVISMEIRRRWS